MLLPEIPTKEHNEAAWTAFRNVAQETTAAAGYNFTLYADPLDQPVAL